MDLKIAILRIEQARVSIIYRSRVGTFRVCALLRAQPALGMGAGSSPGEVNSDPKIVPRILLELVRGVSVLKLRGLLRSQALIQHYVLYI